MAIHRLSIDEFDEVNYELIAIHTSLEDYHLAFFINQKFPVLLSKNKNEIQAKTKEGEAWFSRYTFENTENDVTWDLIQNKNEILVPKKDKSRNLFADASQEIAARVYLLPEFKKVDYFLRIENSGETAEKLISGLNKINKISTIYTVNAGEIKSKNNLIF
ncbi:MAG TPA: IPExxxVDY family protein [Flavobacterium sp.]|nr:IPExxxVDY family protein [Flavobacterium sp.]